jgi:acyl-CoA thioesterase
MKPRDNGKKPGVSAATLTEQFPIPLLQTLGITLEEVGERHAVMAVTVAAAHRNYFGGAHGGLIATLIDTVSFFPQSLIPSGRALTTTNLCIQYVRPAAVGDRLTARAEVLHHGRRTAVLQVSVTDQRQRLIAQGSITLMFLESDPQQERGEQE